MIFRVEELIRLLELDSRFKQRLRNQAKNLVSLVRLEITASIGMLVESSSMKKVPWMQQYRHGSTAWRNRQTLHMQVYRYEIESSYVDDAKFENIVTSSGATQMGIAPSFA